MDKVTPKKVHARLKRVEERGKGLREAVDRLEITDASHIDSFFTHSFLRNRPTISVNEFLRAINLFLANVQGAVQDLDTMQRKGAMPAYPAKALSLTIAHGLFLENNKFPPLTRGGVFDRVLKCALDAGASRTSRYRSRAVGRMDVMSLMRGAKDGFDPQEALAFGKVLSSFPT
ncbi:MAG: hypothetical protein HYY78_19800 [Betaproteobacteria bacterium]|nr:hypothetical protein [Betaproteobacteria bacterium]